MIAAVSSPPNETATELIGRDYLSYSAMNLYRRCPLAFWFKYVVGLPEATVSSSLVFGSAIHSAAEFHFNELLAGNAPPSLDLLLDVFWDAWQTRSDQTIRYGKGEDLNSIGQLADRVLAAFLGCDVARPNGQIIAVEEELRGAITADVPDLLARIDLIVETDESLVVTDFKTARSRWNAGQAADAGEQLLLYSELAGQFAPSKTLKLQFAVITKTKAPTVETHAVALDTQRIERTQHTFQQVWQAIEHLHFYPAPSPMNCPSCPFREPCRNWCG